jgi:hypothetical protein
VSALGPAQPAVCDGRGALDEPEARAGGASSGTVGAAAVEAGGASSGTVGAAAVEAGGAAVVEAGGAAVAATAVAVRPFAAGSVTGRLAGRAAGPATAVAVALESVPLRIATARRRSATSISAAMPASTSAIRSGRLPPLDASVLSRGDVTAADTGLEPFLGGDELVTPFTSWLPRGEPPPELDDEEPVVEASALAGWSVGAPLARLTSLAGAPPELGAPPAAGADDPPQTTCSSRSPERSSCAAPRRVRPSSAAASARDSGGPSRPARRPSSRRVVPDSEPRQPRSRFTRARRRRS